LVTPESILLEEEVQAVILRTDVGDATFMPGHTRLIGALVPGAVRFQREDGSEERAAVHGGFVQVDGEHVVVLSPVAERASDIDIDRARRAAANAAERLAELRGAQSGTAAADGAEPDAEILDAEEAQRRAEVRLEVAGAGSPEPHAAS
jgi:F-type H+-transporting ATPase subunit epsilon